MASVTEYLERLSAQRWWDSETDLLALAMEAGLRQLWREEVLAQYLWEEVSRDSAIEAVGIDWVDLADRQRDATLEDLTWARTT